MPHTQLPQSEARSPEIMIPPVRPPKRQPHGLRINRINRAALGIAAGAILLLGSACGASPATGDAPATDDAVAAIDGDGTIVEPGSAPIVSAAVSEAPAVDEPALPAWVIEKLNEPPPPLALTYPAEGQTFTTSYVVFSGKAEPGSTVAAGPYETKADEYGQWNMGLFLGEGQNVATFTVTDEDGNEITKKVTVNFVPPPTVSDKKDGDGYHKDGYHKDGFEAWQKYGSCGDSTPYDIFKGYADPGTTVTVTSPYGGGTAVAGDDGYWKVKVTFEDAPVGEPFTVTVSDGSTVKTFTFTREK
jgi:hypothetical protein